MRDSYEGLNLVGFEFLPHLNRHDARFLEKARRYSEGVAHDIVGVEDGGAVSVGDAGGLECFGRAVRFRRGVQSPLEAAA